MKNLLIILFLVPFVAMTQNQSFTLQDNLKSVTITPDAIKTRREGTGFDSTKYNLAIGLRNLLNSTTHEKNIAIGVDVLKRNGEGSTTNGYQSFGNIGIGYNVLTNNTLGYFNIGLGHDAIASNLTGNGNIAMGVGALLANQAGSHNIALGRRAAINAEGSHNIALGESSLEQLYTGNNNIGIGYRALRGFASNETNSLNYNVGIGNSSLSSLNGGAQSNVAVGYQSAQFVWQGNYNVAVGAQTLRGGTNSNYESPWNGSRNVAVGYQALGSGQAANDNVGIGYQAGFFETNSNKLYIENTNSSTPLIGGDFNANKVGINRSMVDLGVASQTLQVQGETLITGKTTINATTVARASLDVGGTDAIIVPVGTTAQRPATPTVGMIRYNTTTKKYEGYAEDAITPGIFAWKEFH